MKDAIAQATAILHGLKDMTTPAEPYQLPAGRPSTFRSRRSRRPNRPSARSIAPTAWKGRDIGPVKRTTVFGAFDVTIHEISPTSFQVSIVSVNYCEEIVAKDRKTGQVLAKKSLDDQKVFDVTVTNHPLDDDVVLSIAVDDANDPNNLYRALVPLLQGTDLEVIH